MDQHPIGPGVELGALDHLQVHVLVEDCELGGHHVLEAVTDFHSTQSPAHRHYRLDEIGSLNS